MPASNSDDRRRNIFLLLKWKMHKNIEVYPVYMTMCNATAVGHWVYMAQYPVNAS